MAEGDADGFLMCSVSIKLADDTVIFGKLLDVRGIGATRGSQASPHQNLELDSTTGMKWVPFLFSCIAALKPFTLVCVFSGNYDWSLDFKTIDELEITWGIEDGYTTGGTLTFAKAGVIDIDISGSFEGRPVRTVTVQPSGKPAIDAGTPDA